MGKSRSPDTRRQRLAEIAKELVLKGEVSIKDLAEKYGVSDRMIRDDVDALVNSVFGPAGRSKFQLLRESYHELARKERVRPKADVAAETVTLLKAIPGPSVSVSMSPGSTVCLVAAMMVVKSCPAQIISNSVSLCDLPMPESITLALTGGFYARPTHALVGRDSEQGFEQFHNQVRVGVLGVSGVSEKGELFVHHPYEIPSLKAMLRSVSEHLFVVCDSSKLGREDPWRISDIESLVAGDNYPDTVHRRDPQGREGDIDPRILRTPARRKVTLVTNEPAEPSKQAPAAEQEEYRRQRKTYDALSARTKSDAEQSGMFKVKKADPIDERDFQELRELVPWLRTPADDKED